MLTISRPSSGGGGGGGSWGSITGTLSAQTDLAAALAAKLDKSGGTMTGALALAAGTNAAPSVNFGDSGTGFYKYATNNIGVACNGNMRWYWDQYGSLYNNGAAFVMNSSYGVMPSLYLRTNGLCLLMGASDDVRLERAAAASLQLGSNHATTPTAQKVKAHNVTTGTGADLVLTGGTGSVNGGMVKLSNSVGDVRLSVGDDGIGFFSAAPLPQITTAISAAVFSAGSSSTVTDDSTFDGYTLPQIVSGLRSLGLFA